MRQEHTAGFKLDPGVMPDYLAFGLYLIPIITNKQANNCGVYFGCFFLLINICEGHYLNIT